jgi:hypothetical protein
MWVGGAPTTSLAAVVLEGFAVGAPLRTHAGAVLLRRVEVEPTVREVLAHRRAARGGASRMVSVG